MPSTDNHVNVVLTARTSEYQRNVLAAKKANDQYRQSIKGVIGDLLSLSGAVGIAGGIKGSVSAFAEFDFTIRRVGAISKATKAELLLLNNVARTTGATTEFSATQSAEALLFLSQAGLSVQESISALPGTLQLASAGAVDLGVAADISTNILAGYGKHVGELARVNDVLVNTFTSANTNLNDLGEAFKTAGPVAKAAGQDFDETAVLLGVFANAGIKGSIAGTALAGGIARLAKPTKEANQGLKNVGVSAKDSTGKIRPLLKIIDDLRKKSVSVEDALRIFGQEAGPKFLAAIQQTPASIARLRAEVKKTGTAAAIATAQQAGISGVLKKLGSAIESIAIKMGDTLAPAVIAISKFLAAFAGEITVAAVTLGTLYTAIKIASLLGLSTALHGIGASALFAAIGASKLTVNMGLLRTSMAALPATAIAARIAMGGLATSIGAATVASLKFIATPLGAILAAIAAGVYVAVSAFNALEEQHQSTLSKIEAGTKAVEAFVKLEDKIKGLGLEGVDNAVIQIKRLRADVIQTGLDFDTAAKKGTEFVDNLVTASSNLKNLQVEQAKLQIQLEKFDRKAAVDAEKALTKTAADEAKKRLDALKSELDKSIKAEQQALRDKIRLQKNLLETKIDLAEKARDKQKAALDKALNDEKTFVAAAKQLRAQLSGQQGSRENRIRDIQRGQLSSGDQQRDVQDEAAKALSEAKRLLRLGQTENAKKIGERISELVNQTQDADKKIALIESLGDIQDRIVQREIQGQVDSANAAKEKSNVLKAANQASEQSLAQLNKRLAEIATNQAKLEKTEKPRDPEDVQSDIVQAQTDVDALQAKLDAFKPNKRITIQSNIDTISQQVDALKSNLQTLKNLKIEIPSLGQPSQPGQPNKTTSQDDAGQPIRRASGGLVDGAGTGVSDSVQALLSRGEFVNDAQTVAFHGSSTFSTLKSMARNGQKLNAFSPRPQRALPAIPSVPTAPATQNTMAKTVIKFPGVPEFEATLSPETRDDLQRVLRKQAIKQGRKK